MRTKYNIKYNALLFKEMLHITAFKKNVHLGIASIRKSC